MELTNYAVYGKDGKLVGYINRQGEDARLVDPEGEERLQSFFPWNAVLSWVNAEGCKLKRLESAEPVAVIGE
jgi:hypothetical protein